MHNVYCNSQSGYYNTTAVSLSPSLSPSPSPSLSLSPSPSPSPSLTCPNTHTPMAHLYRDSISKIPHFMNIYGIYVSIGVDVTS
jgi:hypothetical protein